MYAALLILALSLLQVTPTVGVSTDQTWYAPGDEVQITITFFNSNLTQVWLYVDGPDGRNLYFNRIQLTDYSTRAIVVFVTLPEDAADGTYTITVTWDHQYVETGFIVESQPIPEFSFAPVVLFLAVTAALATLSRRKAGARTSAPANDSGARRIR